MKTKMTIKTLLTRAAMTLALIVLTTATAGATDLTGFLTVSSSGTATAYFAYSNHFYKVDWSGINTTETSSVKLTYSKTNNRLEANRNGGNSSTVLRASASESDTWLSSHITSLTPGQSSDGYTTDGTLATGASGASKPKVYKKVCTVTCSAANVTWNWSSDYTTCTATFTCAANTSLTATVNATVTTSGSTATASATFNGTNYSDTKTLVTTYNITYELNGGTNAAGNPTTYRDDTAVTLLAPIRANYDFGGWYTNSGFTGDPVTEIPVGASGDKTFYAKWTRKTYSYVDATGTAQTPVEAELITSSTSLTSLNSGWYVVTENTTCGTVQQMSNGTVNIILCDGATLSVETIEKSSNRTFDLVIWGQAQGTGTLDFQFIDQIKSVTVNGGKLQCSSAIAGKTYAIAGSNCSLTVNGGEVSLASAYSGSVAGSVVFNGGKLYSGKINGNTTLNYSSTADRMKISDFGGSVTVADGKYFKDASGNYYYGTLTDAQKNAIKNVELQPAPNAHNVSIGSIAHGTLTADKAVAETGNSVTVTVAPDAGYSVVSVTYNGSNATKTDDTHYTFTMPGADVTIAAVTTPITYTITYTNLDWEGVTFSSPNPTSYTVESAAITLNNPTRTGHDFMSWNGTGLDTPTQTVTIATGSTGDRTYNANWDPHHYTVSFDGNGATDGTISDQTFTYGAAEALTANAYTRTGYHFSGWNTAANGSGTNYTDGQTVQNLSADDGATVTLYAQWTANTYTVHFEPVIPVNGEMADQTFTYDQAATALRKNGFSTTTGEWLRWNTEADGSGTDYTDEQTVQNLTAEDGGTVTLYAQWRLQHRFNYDHTIFRCYPTTNSNEVIWAYAGETIKVEVINASSQYTIYVTGEDGTAITLNADNTFTMPDQEVNITTTALKYMSYTSILLDGDDGYDIAYLYDANHPTVTPTVTVKDGETALTEGTHYTVAITNNTGSATQMVTATVTVTGIAAGGYTGTATQEFRITPFNIANCEIKGKLEAYDDGYGPYYPLASNMQVWYGDKQLEENTDYSLYIEEPASGEFEVGQSYQATIIGQGDWGGTKTFTFTFVTLHHTIVFNANGGTGTMDNATVDNNGGNAGIYFLPTCSFTAPLNKVFDHWEVSCEPDEEKQPGDYFTAPYIWSEYDVQTITVTAIWKLSDEIPYIAADGTTQTCTGYTVLNGNETELSNEGWYVADGTLNYTGNIILKADVHLILLDGCQMNIGTSENRINNDGIEKKQSQALTIYGQSLDSHMGSLSIYANGYGINAGVLTINGGHVIANTNGEYASALYVSTDITINGGLVEATATGNNSYAIRATQNFNYAGGIVTGNATRYAIYAQGNNYSFTWRNPGDHITIGSTGLYANSTTTATFNRLFTDADGNYYGGTLTGNAALVTLNGKTLSGTDALILADKADNTSRLAAANGITGLAVQLNERTLFKDGDWNTLCLPFSLTAEQIAATDLAGADIRTLSSASLSDGVLTLNFTDEGAVTAITAGTPYIIKWSNTDNATNPVFNGVTVTNTTPAPASFDNGKVTFCGTYANQTFSDENSSILFLGAGNTLYWPKTGARIGACRAYFQVSDAADVRAFNLNFGDHEATGVSEELRVKDETFATDRWYTLDGRMLDEKPTAKGLYIHGNKKVSVK